MFILLLCLLQVKGVVLDRETKEAVIGASVSDLRGKIGTYADMNGLFSLQTWELETPWWSAASDTHPKL